MPDKILSTPDMPKPIDPTAAYLQAIISIPAALAAINDVLCDMAGYLQVLALCEKRRAENENLLTPEDIQELDYEGEGPVSAAD